MAQNFWNQIWKGIWGQSEEGEADNKGGAWPDAPAEVERKRRQSLIQDRARAQQAHRGAPRASRSAGAPQMNMFQEHAAMQNDMYAATNQAWANEMASRKKIAQAERDRQHEYDMELLRQQGAREQAAQEQQQRQSANPMENDEFRQARNRQLLGMAGFGGHTLHIDGQGNKTRTPHPFGNSPFARSLLG